MGICQSICMTKDYVTSLSETGQLEDDAESKAGFCNADPITSQGTYSIIIMIPSILYNNITLY